MPKPTGLKKLVTSLAACSAGMISPSGAANANEIESEMRRQLLAVDKLAAQLYETPEVQDARERIARMFRADPKSANPDSAALIDNAAANMAMEGAILAANSNHAAPKVQWWNTRQHTWPNGLFVRDNRFGLDNPDNFYVEFPVDGMGNYRLVGKMPAKRPTDITLSVLDQSYQETDVVKTVSILVGKDIVTDDQGRFIITIGPDGGEKQTNHLRTSPEAKVVQLRQTIGDWDTEEPFPLYVETSDAKPAGAEIPFDQLAKIAADIAVKAAQVWAIGFPLKLYQTIPANTMTPMFSASRFGGLKTQASSGGRFVLAEDEALIIRTKTYDAGYFSLQLGDQWMVSAEYVERTGNLNNKQVVPDADGNVTFVISPKDPGVYNWVDPGPIRNGYIALRTQNLPQAAPDGEPLLETRLVKLADLRAALPSGTKFVTPEERRKQIADRIAGWNRRTRAIMGD